MIRTKFRVISKKESEGGNFSISLLPVTSGSEENKTFYKYTPGGSIEISTINEQAAMKFVIGKEYYVDFKDSV